jgi:hypothetical protein
VRFDVLGSVGKHVISNFFVLMILRRMPRNFGLCIHFVSPPVLSNVDVTLFVCVLTSWVTLGFGKHFVVNIFADGSETCPEP